MVRQLYHHHLHLLLITASLLSILWRVDGWVGGGGVAVCYLPILLTLVERKKEKKKKKKKKMLTGGLIYHAHFHFIYRFLHRISSDLCYIISLQNAVTGKLCSRYKRHKFNGKMCDILKVSLVG